MRIVLVKLLPSRVNVSREVILERSEATSGVKLTLYEVVNRRRYINRSLGC
jgi:hypothetical protein